MASIQLVVFSLDDQEYGIDALAVNGILRSKKFQIKHIPGIALSILALNLSKLQCVQNINWLLNLLQMLFDGFIYEPDKKSGIHAVDII